MEAALAAAIPPIRMDQPPTLRRRLTLLLLPGAVIAAAMVLVGLVSGNRALVVGALGPVGFAAVAMAVEVSRRRSQADLKRWSPAGTLYVAPATLVPAPRLLPPQRTLPRDSIGLAAFYAWVTTA